MIAIKKYMNMDQGPWTGLSIMNHILQTNVFKLDNQAEEGGGGITNIAGGLQNLSCFGTLVVMATLPWQHSLAVTTTQLLFNY